MSLLKETKATLALSFPIIIGQVSQMMMGVADTVMVGKLGVNALAALTFANTIFMVGYIFGVGLLLSISIATSQHRGANNPAKARQTCRNGLYLAILMGGLLGLLGWGVSPFLSIFKQDPVVTALAPTYFSIIMWSLVPALGAMALKNHIDALNRPWPVFWIFLGGTILNIFLNDLFIFGKWGLPSQGIEGAGYATYLSRFLTLVAVLLWMRFNRSIAEWVPSNWLKGADLLSLKKLCLLGIPSSIQLLTEVGAFSTAGLIVGTFGATPQAAHQIAISASGIAFMLPVGICMAMTVRIGEALGSKEPSRYYQISWSGWLTTLFFMALTTLVFLLFPQQIANAYLKEQEVIQFAVTMLLVIGVYQISDGIQVVSSGILRGLGDVKSTAWLGFMSYWLIGIPCSFLLAKTFGLGPIGVWWGLAIGLLVAAISITWRVFIKIKATSKLSSY